MNLAVMKFSALGDIAATLPFLRAIKQPFSIITSPLGKAFLEDEFSDFIVLKNKSTLSHLKLIGEIRKRRFTDLIDLQGNDRCRYICQWSGAKTTHNGYDPASSYQPFSELVKELAQHASIERIPRECNYIVLNAGSSAKWSAKRPPIQKWAAFASQLNDQFGFPIKLTGSAEEVPYIQSIADALPGDVEVLAGKTSLVELKNLLAKAFLVVSTDSAAMHIAAVQGTPTIGIFGSTTHEGKLHFPWTASLYDKVYYPDGKMPVCTDVVDNYYDHIDLAAGLETLKEFL